MDFYSLSLSFVVRIDGRMFGRGLLGVLHVICISGRLKCINYGAFGMGVSFARHQ